MPWTEKSTTFSTANAYGIYYNKDKFEELGLKVPETGMSSNSCKDIVAKWQTPLELQGQMLGPSLIYNQLALRQQQVEEKKPTNTFVILSQIPLNCLIRIMKDDIISWISFIKGSKQRTGRRRLSRSLSEPSRVGDVLMTPNGSGPLMINEQTEILRLNLHDSRERKRQSLNR